MVIIWELKDQETNNFGYFQLINYLFVPDLLYKLLFVSRLTKKLKYTV